MIVCEKGDGAKNPVAFMLFIRLMRVAPRGGEKMKKIEVVIKAERFETLKEIFIENGATGLMLTNVMGYGNQSGFTQQYRGVKTTVQLLPKLRVEVAVRDEAVEPIIREITEKLRTEEVGDGKIFVYNVEEIVRIRTGERGEIAL